MPELAGTDLIGHVVIYVGSLSDHHRDRCVVVGYDEDWDRYILDPLAGGACTRRIARARRVSFLDTGRTMPVCECGHAITPHHPETGECLRCTCTTHQVPRTELADDELFTRVATGGEQIIRDDNGNPVAVIVPYSDYLIQRADAAFDRP